MVSTTPVSIAWGTSEIPATEPYFPPYATTPAVDLPVGGLKLDRSFTVGVASGDQRSIRVSQGLAGLARGLALRMVVEGVQGERDAAILLGQGWTFAQGWYFGRAERRMTQHLAAAPVGE